MKRKIVAMCTMTLVSCVASVALAETAEQAAKDNKVVKSAKLNSANEKMMPAPDEQLKRLTNGLKLTDEQQKQIKPMLIDEFAKLKRLRNDENMGPKQIQIKVEALRSETVAKMKTVLNPEQVEKLDLVSKEIKANKQKRIKENRKSLIGTGTQADDPAQQPKQ